MKEQKIIFIAGANGLVGKELGEYLVSKNFIVVKGDIKYPSDISKNKVFINITDKVSIENSIKDVVNKYHKIDCFINCSYPKNKNYGKKFFDVDYSDFSENVSLHLGGYFLCMQAFANYFIKQGFGNIINFSSIYGVVAPKFEIYENTSMTMPVEYAAIKSGIIHLTKYVAKMLKGKSIRANSISIGGIFDNQNPLFVQAYKNQCLNKGMLNIEDIFGTILFLITDDSKYINGQNIIVDDGFTL